MMYQGGKTKLAKPIASIIRPAILPGTRYVEPFLGSAAVAVELVPYSTASVLSEGNESVALMWTAVLQGWVPPSSVTAEEYAELKAGSLHSALHGFVGTGCSFGGKWFGGLAKGSKGRDYIGQAQRSVLRRASVLSAHGVSSVRCADYRSTDADSSSVVYCDPPYANTMGYPAVGDFDSDAFWAQVREWVSVGACVYVSEYTAPADFVSVWSVDRAETVAIRGEHPRVTDKLFVHESQATS